MNELMNIQDRTPIEIALGIDEKGYTTSKKLYEFLELNPANYSRWCNRNIVNNVFAEEGVDYWRENSSSRMSFTGRGNTTDYKLSSNFAKKLSMISDSPKGEAARDYFLACEQTLKEKMESERFKYSLLTLSPQMKFQYLHPKFAHLEEILNLTRKELYSLIYKTIEENYHISVSEEVTKYCIDHHIPFCYPMTVLEDVPHLFIFLYDTVEAMMKKLNNSSSGREPLSVTTIESIS